jgi:hypothetical protein
MEVVWATEIGVGRDRLRLGGGGRAIEFVGDDGSDAFVGECPDRDGAGGHFLGPYRVEILEQAEHAEARAEACSGCGRLARMAMTNPSVSGP